MGIHHNPDRQTNAMDNTSELACVYSALILADDDIDITGEKINTILKAAKVTVEPFWPSLFAKALSSCNVKDLISSVGSGAGAAPAAAAPAAGGAAPAAEEKKEEKKEEPEEESMMIWDLVSSIRHFKLKCWFGVEDS